MLDIEYMGPYRFHVYVFHVFHVYLRQSSPRPPRWDPNAGRAYPIKSVEIISSVGNNPALSTKLIDNMEIRWS